MPPAAKRITRSSRGESRKISSQSEGEESFQSQASEEIKADEVVEEKRVDDEARLRATIADTRALLSTLAPQLLTRSPSKEPPNAFEIAPENLSLHTIRDQLLSKSDRKRSVFGQEASPSKRRRSSLSQIMADGELDIDWAVYKDWPEGILEEEELMLDYFRKLKFIYLEQETKMRFLADVQDDVENGTEATVYSAGEVAERERMAKTLKSQLAEAKSVVRALRSEVDSTADLLFQPWQEVESSSREADQLIKEIGDMELELAKIKAQSHGKSSIAAIAGREGPLTAAEAEEVCDAQILQMTSLENETTEVQRAVEASKKELVASLKSLDRLNAERSTAEKYAAEAKLGGGRDLETEELCANHLSSLVLLKGLLGISEIKAVDSHQLSIVYRLPNPGGKGKKKKKQPDETVTLNLTFSDVGGRVSNVEILSATGEPVELSEASASRLKALEKANDVPLIVQEVLSAF